MLKLEIPRSLIINTSFPSFFHIHHHTGILPLHTRPFFFHMQASLISEALMYRQQFEELRHGDVEGLD
jgi:hypothetical protein